MAVGAVVLKLSTTPPKAGDDPRWHAHADCLPGWWVTEYHVWENAPSDIELGRARSSPRPPEECDCMVCTRRTAYHG